MSLWTQRLIGCGLALFCLVLLGADYTKKTPKQIAEEVKAGKAVLLDVREKDEWDEAHFAKAQHLPMSGLKNPKFLEEKKDLFPEGKTVYLHCKSGGRCLKVAKDLEKKGIKTQAVKTSFEELKGSFEVAGKP